MTTTVDIYPKMEDNNQTLQHTDDKITNSHEKSAESNLGFQMFDLLDETFSTRPSNESENTTDLIKRFQYQTKRALRMSSDSYRSYSYPSVSGETAQSDYPSQSKESSESSSSSDVYNSVDTNNSDETGSVNDQENLDDEMDWKEMVSEILSQFYDTSVDKMGRLLYDISEFTNVFSQSSNQTSNVTKDLEETKTKVLMEKKADKNQAVLTREEQRKKLKAELAAMDAETAHKFKSMLLKQKKERENSMENRHDLPIETNSTERREGEIGC